MKPSRKPKYKLDPKKFETLHAKKKKKDDWSGSDIFDEIKRSKPHRH